MTETTFEKLQQAEYWTHEARCFVDDEDRESLEEARSIIERLMYKYKDYVC